MWRVAAEERVRRGRTGLPSFKIGELEYGKSMIFGGGQVTKVTWGLSAISRQLSVKIKRSTRPESGRMGHMRPFIKS